MRRRPKAEGDRPPIPERLRRFDPKDWWDDHWPSPRDENHATELGVEAYCRFRDARDRWAAEHGYSSHEMYEASRPGPVVDPPKWRTP